MSAAVRYVKNVFDTLKTTLVGMKITGKYLLQKPITVQYPDERLPIPNRYRGIHYLEQEKCIECLACARACPIDCIEMDAVRHGKELEWISFTLDYQKCMFCELCVYPCPKDCIHMGTEFAFVSYDRSEFVHDLLSYRGMSRDAKARMIEAEEIERVRRLQEQILADRTGRNADQVRRDIERQLVLTPDAAIDYGIVDTVVANRSTH